MSVTYFAYGANLDLPAMQTRCPGARPLQTALLADHRLVAMREGWLSITPAPGAGVAGLLWQLEAVHLKALDAYEEGARTVSNPFPDKWGLICVVIRGPRAIRALGPRAGPHRALCHRGKPEAALGHQQANPSR